MWTAAKHGFQLGTTEKYWLQLLDDYIVWKKSANWCEVLSQHCCDPIEIIQSMAPCLSKTMKLNENFTTGLAAIPLSQLRVPLLVYLSPLQTCYFAWLPPVALVARAEVNFSATTATSNGTHCKSDGRAMDSTGNALLNTLLRGNLRANFVSLFNVVAGIYNGNELAAANNGLKNGSTTGATSDFNRFATGARFKPAPLLLKSIFCGATSLGWKMYKKVSK